MNEGQFNDPLCYLCLCGAVVSSLSLRQGPWVLVQQFFLFLKKKLSRNSGISVITFRENSISFNDYRTNLSSFTFRCFWDQHFRHTMTSPVCHDVMYYLMKVYIIWAFPFWSELESGKLANGKIVHQHSFTLDLFSSSNSPQVFMAANY